MYREKYFVFLFTFLTSGPYYTYNSATGLFHIIIYLDLVYY